MNTEDTEGTEEDQELTHHQGHVEQPIQKGLRISSVSSAVNAVFNVCCSDWCRFGKRHSPR